MVPSAVHVLWIPCLAMAAFSTSARRPDSAGSVNQTMDIGDTTPSNTFPVENGDNSPVFNVLETIDRWAIGERPISDKPIPSGAARAPLEKQSGHSDGNKKLATESELESYTIVRPWESQSSNAKETHNSSVIGKYVELEPDLQKEKKITKTLEVSPADVVAGHSSRTSGFAKPESNLTCNISTSTDPLEKQDQVNIVKTRKTVQYNYKEESKIKATERTKKNHRIIIIYECNNCDFKVTETSQFNKHMETCTHFKDFARTRGDYSAVQKSNLNRHMRIHTKEKPYACKECNFSTAKKSNLKTHMRIHTKEKPYSCNECNYSAAQKSNLIKHMRIHTKEKPYACKECNYSAAQKGTLIKHMRIHTKEKPYACNECNYSAAHKSNLIIHMRIHTKVKPYACNECNFSAAHKSNLIKHMKTHTTKTICV